MPRNRVWAACQVRKCIKTPGTADPKPAFHSPRQSDGQWCLQVERKGILEPALYLSLAKAGGLEVLRHLVCSLQPEAVPIVLWATGASLTNACVRRAPRNHWQSHGSKAPGEVLLRDALPLAVEHLELQWRLFHWCLRICPLKSLFLQIVFAPKLATLSVARGIVDSKVTIMS